MRSFWTESQKKKEKNNFSFLFYFLIKNEEEERSPYFLSQLPLLPCTRPSVLGLFNNSNSSSECVKPRNTLYCVWTRSDGQ